MVRTTDSQSRESGFQSSCCCFEAWVVLFPPPCLSSLNCVNEYLAIDSGGYVDKESAWLNASQRSRDGLGMNRSARG